MTDLTALLTDFLADARWFGGKGRPFQVTGTAELGTVGTAPEVDFVLATVTYEDTGETELYQLPLAWYAEAPDRLAHALVGEVDGRFAYDAVHDRAAMDHVLRAFAAERSQGDLDFHRLPGHDLDLDVHSTLFSGEQSNSSVMYGEDSVLKLFRKVTPGPNPDIGVHEALTRAGSEHVPALYGWLESGTLQLGMLQQFLRTASDGWDLALASVRNLYAEGDLHADEVGGDFAAEAARLGEALRAVHGALAEHFPTRSRSSAELAELSATMTDRLAAALEIAPDLAEHAPSLRATYTAMTGLSGDTVQQIHGDLHLGQTLRTVKGWKIVDFEGEPAKPLADRLLPDSPWRDVAGMIRSFSYAPRASAMNYSETEGAEQRSYRAHEWSERNREAFLAAYAGRELTADEETLLEAYIADKAVYEVVYEARNRPTWISIPLDAIARMRGAR